MRIGIDARFYGKIGKGLGRYTEKLIRELEQQEDQNEYFIFLRQENFEEYQPQNSRFTRVLADYEWYSLAEEWHLPRLLRRYKLDLVHFLHFNVPLLYRQPFVVTIHDLILLAYPTVKASELPPFLYWLKYLIYRGIIASALRRAKVIFAVSYFTKTDIIAHYPGVAQKIVVTYEATDPNCLWMPPKERQLFLQKNQLLQTPAGQNEAFVPESFCLYVGNAYPHKNLEIFLPAAKHFPQILFILVGKEDYFYRRLARVLVKEKISNIYLLGYVPDQFLETLYQNALVYIFPSLYEGFGLPSLEACARGLPVLASNHGALPEVLGDGARYFDPQDPNDFLTKLKVLIEHKEERAVLRLAGYVRANQFSWKKMAVETRAAYQSVLQ